MGKGGVWYDLGVGKGRGKSWEELGWIGNGGRVSWAGFRNWVGLVKGKGWVGEDLGNGNGKERSWEEWGENCNGGRKSWAGCETLVGLVIGKGRSW